MSNIRADPITFGRSAHKNIMTTVEYPKFSTINPSDFLPLLNSEKIRKHLIEHDLFTIDTLTTWMHSKTEVDATLGCKYTPLKKQSGV